MSDEEIFRGFQKEWRQPSPLWNMLWTPPVFFKGNTFNENLDRLLPHGEIRDRFKEFFQGSRWNISELSEECREKFEFFMLDYRSCACFVHSSQVDDYASRVLKIDMKLYERSKSVLINETMFDWSDTVEKACEFINDEIPTGADSVMYLLFKCFAEQEDGFLCVPELKNVFFHGEDVKYYKHLPHNASGYFMQYDEIPLLVSMAIEGCKHFRRHKWTTESIDEAIEYVQLELSCIKKDYEYEDTDIYDFYKDNISRLEKSLNLLNSLDYSWSVSERVGLSNESYHADDELVKEIENMEIYLDQKEKSSIRIINMCKCGNSHAKDCQWKKCGKCCNGCEIHKKRKRS